MRGMETARQRGGPRLASALRASSSAIGQWRRNWPPLASTVGLHHWPPPLASAIGIRHLRPPFLHHWPPPLASAIGLHWPPLHTPPHELMRLRLVFPAGHAKVRIQQGPGREARGAPDCTAGLRTHGQHFPRVSIHSPLWTHGQHFLEFLFALRSSLCLVRPVRLVPGGVTVSNSAALNHPAHRPPAGRGSQRSYGARPAVGESSVILLPPPLPSLGVSIGMEWGCQRNDRTLADG